MWRILRFGIRSIKISKKFLITGGAGFIGSAVIRHIINNTDHSVVNVDKLTYASNLESLASIENNIRLNYPLVGAAGYVGLMIWHSGISGSAPIKVAEDNHLSSLMSSRNDSYLYNDLPTSLNFDFNGKEEKRKLYHDDIKGYRFNTWYDSNKKFYGGERVDDPVEELQAFCDEEHLCNKP